MSDFSDVQIDFHPTHGGPPDPTPSNPDDLGNPFLSTIPEADRNVVAKYIDAWNSGVTKRFQDIHNQYKPYTELGEADYLRKAVEFVKYIDQDPQAVYEYLGGVLREMGYEGDDEQYDQGQQYQETGPTYEGIPQEFTERFSAMEQALITVVQQLQGQQEDAQADLENRQLDNLLREMHTKHGDFDDSFIVSRFIAGDDPERAIQAWNAVVEKISSAAPKSSAPSFLSGNGGGVPTGQVDPRNLSRQDTKALVASMLKAANEG